MTKESEPIPLPSASPIRNSADASVAGHLVQAGVVRGDVHLHGTARSIPIPRQLPCAPGSFVGRWHECSQLDAVMDSPGATVAVSAVTGAGGIGKTWLVLHWAHRHLDQFPDGQLFVDLRGFAPSGQPMPPDTAVRGFLDAFGIEPARIPVDIDARVGLYRSLVANKRLLIVLDNAHDTTHVAQLVPGNPTCTVLVTSRNQLSGLLTTHSARRLNLDVLDVNEARELLAARLGQTRIDAEPDAVTELLSYCAGLPLALSIVASRAAAHPSFPLAELTRELRDTAVRLDALDDGEAASITRVLSWSFAALPPRPAKALEMLGLAPGPDISLSAAAVLIGLTDTQTRAVLRTLERASLLQQQVPGRWQIHDLVRLYAVQQAELDQSEEDRNAALRRLIDFYLRTAHSADRLINPRRPPIDIDEPLDTTRTHPLHDQEAAWAWFDAELMCLEASEHLAASRWHHAAWQLTWALDTFRYRRGLLLDRIAAWHKGLAAAQQDGDPNGTFIAHRLLGHAYIQIGHHDEALEHLEHALRVAGEAGNLLNQAHTHTFLMKARQEQGSDQRALEHATEARRLFQLLGHPIWEAQALTSMGKFAARLGQHADARIHCDTALLMCRRNHDGQGETEALHNLGYLEQLAGDHHRALDYYRQTLDQYRRLGHTYYEADVLDRVGESHVALDQRDSARTAWQQAERLYADQHRTDDAERIQRRLSELDASLG
ncbi:ATP-binding protein [Nocardia sp. NPDC058058]|uniref:ATP-binding protein n=1 Tax=Nocardia sp. NPDC058058 TaxID=3346317 RepID=UPI0036DD5191